MAENYFTEDPASLEAGEVVSLHPEKPEYIVKASTPYDERIVGVISTAPGVLLGSNATSARPVALAGRVPVKVSNENGPIKIGDYLTSSEIPGVAMAACAKASAAKRATCEPGRVIGSALEPFSPEDPNSKSMGRIQVFINPHFNLNTPPEENPSLLDRFTRAVKIALQKLGLIIEEGVATLRKLVVKEEICINETCINEDQLKALLQGQLESMEVQLPYEELLETVVTPPPVSQEIESMEVELPYEELLLPPSEESMEVQLP